MNPDNVTTIGFDEVTTISSNNVTTSSSDSVTTKSSDNVSTGQTSPLCSLPLEILYGIANNLPTRDHASLSETCRFTTFSLQWYLFRRHSDNDCQYPVVSAIERNNIDTIRRALAYHMPPSIHASVDGFATPLGLAAERGHVAQVSYLIHRGADANIAGKDGVSPLTHAFLGLETRAEKSTYEQRPDPTPYLKIITKLLERGANPTLNMSAEYDEWAAPRYPLTYVFELLSLGIIKTGQTIRLVKLLIRCGADPNTVDNQGHAPTHIIVSLNEPA